MQGNALTSSSKIHPSATIHPSVIMEGDIEIGEGTIIGAHCYLKGPLIIGSNNHIGHQVMIGVDPEHKIKPGVGIVTIGNGNVIREFSVIQRGIGDLDTQIQNDCYIMAYSYIAHDCLIESDVIPCAKVSLSGHCHILKGAVLGLASSLHQFSTIGSHAFVGMGSVVVKDIPPFCIIVGNPARFAKFNEHPLEKLGIKLEDLKIENSFLQSDHPYVRSCVNSFNTHVRRKVLPISMDS
jgi:UDP-N-acetylglucosamine acyltransferase